MAVNQSQSDFECFMAFFQTATQLIESAYMQLPVAGMESPIYRERVYCYELYHRLRSEIGGPFPYSLSGEIDKSRHPYVRGNNLNQVKPDFLFHKPGVMDANLVVMEVKAVNVLHRPGGTRRSGGVSDMQKDLEHLTAFRRIVRGLEYQYAIYLFFGDEEDWMAQIKTTALDLSRNSRGKIDLELIDLYWHRRHGESAEKQAW